MLSAKNNLLLVVLFNFVLISSEAQAANPQRIVSLAPSLTEALYLLGMDDRVAGVTVFCNHPPQAKQKEKVGTIIEPSIEKIVSLSPDLVVATKEGNRPQTVNSLRKLGIRVEVFNHARDFHSICENFIRLGKLVGKEVRAKEIVEQAKRKVNFISTKVANLPKPKVFWELGARPLVTISREAFVNEFIRLGGGINIVDEARMRYPILSREEILRQDPDVIILVTMGDVTKEEKRSWQKFKNLKAIRSDRIYIVDADLVCRPSPLTFAEGVEEIAKLLHPETFSGR